jgi:hypothetical protein
MAAGRLRQFATHVKDAVMATKAFAQFEWDDTSNSPLSRRGLLLAGVGLVGTLAGGRILLKSYNRQRRANDLAEAAHRVVASPNRTDLASLPKAAADKIERYFAGVCLDVHRFTGEICSNTFAEKLRACGSEEHRRLLLDSTFNEKLISAVEMKNTVEGVLAECAAQIDKDWAIACREIEQIWGVQSGSLNGKSLPSRLQTRLDSLIVQEMRRVQLSTHPLTQRPSLGETGMSIGRAAFELIPLARFGAKVYLPAVVVAGLAYLWQFIWGQIAHQECVYRSALSEQLSLLSGRIAAQCEVTLQERITQLQAWQKTAIERISREIARDEISLLI